MTALLDTNEVIALLKISRNTLTDMIEAGEFPAPILFGKRKRRWKAEVVAAWMAAL